MKTLPVLIVATMLLGACTSLPDNPQKHLSFMRRIKS